MDTALRDKIGASTISSEERLVSKIRTGIYDVGGLLVGQSPNVVFRNFSCDQNA
jgi:hypothetical protein